jgi:hypothetical protein
MKSNVCATRELAGHGIDRCVPVPIRMIYTDSYEYCWHVIARRGSDKECGIMDSGCKLGNYES